MVQLLGAVKRRQRSLFAREDREVCTLHLYRCEALLLNGLAGLRGYFSQERIVFRQLRCLPSDWHQVSTFNGIERLVADTYGRECVLDRLLLSNTVDFRRLKTFARPLPRFSLSQQPGGQPQFSTPA